MQTKPVKKGNAMSSHPDASPINPLPPVVVALALAILAVEILLWAAGKGFIGGAAAHDVDVERRVAARHGCGRQGGACLERGQLQFSIYCSVCHGMNGRGNGLVNQRAQSILSGDWVPPSSLHQDTLYSDVYPEGKLFSTISKGIRKMPGYAAQIKVEDRWAIVAYVRALQKSQNASLEAVPESKKADVEKAVADAKAEIQRQAEEAAKAAAEAEKASNEEEKPAEDAEE